MSKENEKTEEQKAKETEEVVDQMAENAEVAEEKVNPEASAETKGTIEGAEPASEPKHEPTLEEKLQDAEERILRARAEFDNYRKRTLREFAETRERAKIGVINDFLPVYDFFQMAMTHANQTPDFNVLKQGMDMILNEFTKCLDNLGMKAIDAVGKPFDPHVHEAVKSEVSDTVPEGVVIAQWKTGYKIGEELVRPSMVVVSSGKAKEEAKEETKEE